MVISGLELYRWERAGFLVLRDAEGRGVPPTLESLIDVMGDLLSVEPSDFHQIEHQRIDCGNSAMDEWAFGDSTLSVLQPHDPMWHPEFVDVILAGSPVLLKVAPGSHIEFMPAADVELIATDRAAQLSCEVLVSLGRGDVLYLHSHVLRKFSNVDHFFRFQRNREKEPSSP